MATSKQHARGTTATLDARTLPAGNVEVDTDENDLRVSDGATAGGHRVYNAVKVDANIAAALALAVGYDTVVTNAYIAADAIVQGNLTTHANLTNNPHSVTAAQIGVETGATADQTGAEIKTAYEGEADTNAYTDADAAAVAGTVGGTWTPTISATTNIDATTAYADMYHRIGDVVSVGGRIAIDPTATGQVTLEIDLPVASDLGAGSHAGGTITAIDGTILGYISAETTNDTLLFTATVSATINKQCGFNAWYRVI